MIRIILSERDFDYEIQALVNSFFPGEHSRVEIQGGETVQQADPDSLNVQMELMESQMECTGIQMEPVDSRMDSEELQIMIMMTKTDISIGVRNGRSPWQTGHTEVTGTEDWHRKEGKKAHPYRTYYKNELKKLLFALLRDFPEEYLAYSGGYQRKIPAWGTMTGVRPTKIVMNGLLSDASVEQMRQELQETYLCSPEKTELGIQIAVKEAALLRQIRDEQGYSLYISIPFCPTTCLYCSFPSYPWEQFSHLAEEYLQALKQEIRATADLMKNRTLSSVYIGGGTPTALSANQLRELIGYVRSCYPLCDACEFTVEAGRPDSISREKLSALREMGVDRISVNPQTMQQKTLDLIGRKHTVQETENAFRMAREEGFSNINMDLIIGLPGETVSDFRDTLLKVGELNPDSLTIHSLVIKRASRLRSVLEEQAAAAKISLEEWERGRGEELEQMLHLGERFAAEQGYEPYYMYRQKNSAGHAGSTGQENIGYAHPGSECLYNILIMEEMQTIMAVGAGASTKLYHTDLGQVSRVENVKSITDYIERIDEMIDRKVKNVGQSLKNC